MATLKRTAVIDVVGLTPALLPHLPKIDAFARRGKVASITPVIPAVTATAHATYMTGEVPTVHGAVANGWYFRDLDDIKLWRQSNKLVEAPKIWDVGHAADPGFTCADLFWWFNMNSTVDYLVTPRPMYPSDGRKLPDVYTKPMELRDRLQSELGQFPLFNFWGPNANIKSSAWIAEAATKVEARYSPTLSLVYLPHLDYCLQTIGPDPDRIAPQLKEIDDVAGDLIAFYERKGIRVIVLSEYGMSAVTKQIHINRLFRQKGWISYREELGRDMIDPATCRAFAVADHQIAHVYVNDPTITEEVRALLEGTDGVAEVLDEAGKAAHGLAHPRAGDLVALADLDAWFTYYFWLDDDRAPDYARTVDIHQKPGYDPAEMVWDTSVPAVKPRAIATILRRKAGFRGLLQTVPLNGDGIHGSHGVPTSDAKHGPVFITSQPDLLTEPTIDATDVFGQMKAHVGIG